MRVSCGAGLLVSEEDEELGEGVVARAPAGLRGLPRAGRRRAVMQELVLPDRRDQQQWNDGWAGSGVYHGSPDVVVAGTSHPDRDEIQHTARSIVCVVYGLHRYWKF
jgi:hypothetical protein